MKIKCVRLKCEECQIEGTGQIFYNNSLEAKYVRVRHYKGLNANKKPVFEYHKVSVSPEMQALLKTEVAKFDQKVLGQSQANSYIDQNSKVSSLNQNINQNKECLGSLARWGVTLVR